MLKKEEIIPLSIPLSWASPKVNGVNSRPRPKFLCNTAEKPINEMDEKNGLLAGGIYEQRKINLASFLCIL